MEQELIKDVISTLVSVDELITSHNRYNIPRYQRLYVWEDEQVDTLLNDLYEACKANKELFYLGGVLIVKHEKLKNTFDLVDGQQRFTTLWLIALELKGVLEGFTVVNEGLRLGFSIREDATIYFEKAIKGEAMDIDEETDNESLIKIDKARRRIYNFLRKLEPKPNEKASLSAFIRNKVRLIISEVPEDTDLNKLFEVINNRGEQLQHHEILKSLLLSHIRNKQERARYGKIWNACADMENYIEKSMQIEAGKNLSAAYYPLGQVFDLKQLLEIMTTERSTVSRTLSLNSILDKKFDAEEEEEEEYIDENPNPEDDELQNVRSILTFAQLLLHTLRIYLFKNDLTDIQRINEKELLSIFKEHFQTKTEKEVKAFISILWEIRVCFDLYIIKWVKQNEADEVHLVKPLEKYNQKYGKTYYLRRRDIQENDGFSLLQSMLYHSQQITTHYWLTPLLYKAYDTRNKEELYTYLRKLDNALFCTQKENTLPERTWNAMRIEIEEEKDNYSCTQLDSDQGVSMPHYWFYKTEFVLWYFLKDRKDPRITADQQLWRNFRMMAKNSVEHISPQNPNYMEDIVSQKQLNGFGNLALVSRSINSEYSNKPFREKRERFLYHNKAKLDSLKLALVYHNGEWKDSLAAEHKEEIVRYFEKYFREN